MDVSRLASNSLKINELRKEKCVEFGPMHFHTLCDSGTAVPDVALNSGHVSFELHHSALQEWLR